LSIDFLAARSVGRESEREKEKQSIGTLKIDYIRVLFCKKDSTYVHFITPGYASWYFIVLGHTTS